MAIKKTDIMKLVKAKCLDCCCGEATEVKLCAIERCPLFSIRLGAKGVEAKATVSAKPKKTRKPMSEAHKAAMKTGRDAAKAAKK